MSEPVARPLLQHPIAIGILGLCAGLIIAYGVGLWQRSAALTAQTVTHSAELAAKGAELAASAQRLAEAEHAGLQASSRAGLVEVRLAIFQALHDLDQRNFGVADERLRAAAAHFDSIDAAALGLDPSLLDALQAEVAATQVLMAVDLEPLRLHLLELAARIEAQTAEAFSTRTQAQPPIRSS